MSNKIYYVPMLETIRLRNLNTGAVIHEEEAEWSQRRFFIDVCAGDPSFGQGADADFAVTELVAALMAADADKLPYILLSEGLWRRCRKVIEQPQKVFVPSAKYQLLPFARAILDAPTEKPKAEEKPVNGASTEEPTSGETPSATATA